MRKNKLFGLIALLPMMALTGCGSVASEWKDDAKSIEVCRGDKSVACFTPDELSYDNPGDQTFPYKTVLQYKEEVNAISIKLTKKWLQSEYVAENEYKWVETGSVFIWEYKYANVNWKIVYKTF